jgi:predicted restriction endonuclease
MPLGSPHSGPDVRENILCVCPNDHVLLDYGAIKVEANLLEGIGKEFIDYHNDNVYGKQLRHT